MYCTNPLKYTCQTYCWFRNYGVFCGQLAAGSVWHKFLSWQTSLLCIVVELVGEGLRSTRLPCLVDQYVFIELGSLSLDQILPQWENSDTEIKKKNAWWVKSNSQKNRALKMGGLFEDYVTNRASPSSFSPNSLELPCFPNTGQAASLSMELELAVANSLTYIFSH